MLKRREQERCFFISLNHFRDVMCSTKYTLENKENAFMGLAQDYLRCELTEDDDIFFVSICREWDMR